MSKDSVCLLPLISSCRASKALCTSKSPKRFFQKHLPGKRLNILRSQVGRYCQLLTLRQRVRRQLTNWEFPLWRARSDRALSSSGGGSITIRGKREKRQALNSRPFHLDGRANFLGDTAFRLLRSLPRQTPRGRFVAGDTVPLRPADRLIKGRDRRRKPEAAVAQVTEEVRRRSACCAGNFQEGVGSPWPATLGWGHRAGPLGDSAPHNTGLAAAHREGSDAGLRDAIPYSGEQGTCLLGAGLQKLSLPPKAPLDW